MLEDVKKALRVSNTAYDTEITDLIDAAKLDLRLAGVFFEDSKIDALLKRAIITYCKANFGYDNAEANRLQRSYDLLKMHLSMSGDYHVPVV